MSSLHDEAGGSIEASSASELPRNRRQVYNVRSAKASGSNSRRPDQVFDLIKQCKEDSLPGGRNFVRSVNVDSSLSCVLASDAQLKNLVRFCTRQGAFCVMGIDSTFNLGKFYVTVTTYTYSHLENISRGTSPTFFGPIFVHTERTFEAYHYFFSTLLKLEPKLTSIRAIGTDGERAITKAIEALFPQDIVLLRCYLHMKENIRRKLIDLLLPECIREEILRDIFGTQQGSVYVKGIVDSEDVGDFDHRLLLLKAKWDELELSVHPQSEPDFHTWILRNEASVMKDSMIASVRQRAGLGCPPAKYTTNRNESMNRGAKDHANYCRSSWVQLNNNMFDLVTDQLKEVERAVYGMGEYTFKTNYKKLMLPSQVWFMKTPEQRQQHLCKVFETHSIPFQTRNESESTSTSSTVLSVHPERSGITTLPADMLTSMWKKAERLLKDPNGICDAPGMINSKCVASETGGKPHVVTLNKQGLPICDDSCLGWKSQKICSHVLAAAEVMGSLERFLQSYKGSNNYTAVVSHGLSKSVGSKPGKTKRKGPANVRKVAIESYIDPLQSLQSSGIFDNANVTHDHTYALPGGSTVDGGGCARTSVGDIPRSTERILAHCIVSSTVGSSSTSTPGGGNVRGIHARNHHTGTPSGTLGGESHASRGSIVDSSHTRIPVGGGNGASSHTHTPGSNTVGCRSHTCNMLSGTVGGSSCAPSVSSVGGGGVHSISGSSFRTHSPSGSATHAHAQDTSSGSHHCCH